MSRIVSATTPIEQFQRSDDAVFEGDLDVHSLVGRRATQRWERLSVGDLFERLVSSRPDKVALIGWDGAYGDPSYARMTYRQADAHANQVANGLIAAGLERGDRVLMVCGNSVEAIVLKVAIAKAGLVVAAINPGLAAEVIEQIIAHVEPAFAVIDAESWPHLGDAFARAGLDVGITVDIGGDAVAGSRTLVEFARGHSVLEPEVEIHADDIWEILFTSGTTSVPKGVMISHSSTYFAAYSFALTLTRRHTLESDLVLGSFLPIVFHSGDQVLPAAFLSGGSLVIGRSADADQLAQAVSALEITSLWAGSPAMVEGLANALLSSHGVLSGKSVRSLLFGWAPLPPSTLAKLKQTCGNDVSVIEIFGQTESISCHRFSLDEFQPTFDATSPRVNYVGIPAPILASRLVDVDGLPIGTGTSEVGEVVYRSPAIMSGYYKDPEATRKAFRSSWLHSGDLCMYDDAGIRIMLDRVKDVVKSGGENVSSIRVESAVKSYPGVAAVAVVGLPHDRWGEAVTAFVVAEPGVILDLDSCAAHTRQQLAGFERPKRFVLIDAMPESVGGKVQKFKLRESYAMLYRQEVAGASAANGPTGRSSGTIRE